MADNGTHIFIAIPVFNRIELTKRCISSIHKSQYENYTIIVCDDGSTDGTTDYIIANYKEVVLLRGSGELWWSGATNECAKYALEHADENDVVLTLNNDVIINHDYLQLVVDAHLRNKNALIGSLVVFIDDPNKIETAESLHNWTSAKKGYANRFGEPVTDAHHGLRAVPKLCGKGVLVPVKVFREIGLYDAVSFPQYAGDEDFSMRAKEAGYEVLLNMDARVMSDYMATGTGTRHTKPVISEFLCSLFSIRSPNNLIIKWRLTKKHCPKLLIPQHIVFDLVRTFGGFARRYMSYYLSSKQ